jgi:hypothetical protein
MYLTEPYIALPQPNPEWSPQHVLTILLEALQHNDHPVADSGIRVAFSFAAPANRALTGPIERFVAMVKNSLYAPLIDHRQAECGPLEIDGNQTQVRVALIDAVGASIEYLFVLSRQPSGLYAGCWMTDGVMRL